ncbi:MAG: ThiF family adenylyltransferase [Gemmataceae bacterium]|nr:ThiF family adenylyltransferase [Gemmata sp.]MDW8198876.1 ThiF family adenylyltransferase [Gemmataceae bacterium]
MHLLQLGAGSGGIVVLDLMARDPRITHITLIEPDVYQAHNVYRHLFPPSAVGQLKAELARQWVEALRPDIRFHTLVADITDPQYQAEFARCAAACDVGICAADNEAAKLAFDALLRAAGKPWTLGEVLSGGIGGWVHRFLPGAACYGCVASYLQREVVEQPAAPPPDYRQPHSPLPETTIPASKAAIAVIASWHALVTFELLSGSTEADRSPPKTESPNPAPPPPCTSLLVALQAVPGVFEVPYRTHRFTIPRSPSCLTCGSTAALPTGDALDAAVDDALARLGSR